MATDKNTLIGWFVKGAKPLASQFAAWINSYWHKDEKIPVSSIEGLQDEFDKKADAELLTQEKSDREQAVSDLSTAVTQQIADEATARQTALETLSSEKEDKGVAASLVSDEATARQTADNSISQAVSELTAALTIVQNWKSAMTNADADSVINTLTELLDLAKNVPEGADLAALLSAKVSTSDIVNNLTSVLANVPLSAYQGNVLKGLIDTLTTTLAGKQSTLVSGTNIKTINGTSLLGSGDLALSGFICGSNWILVPGSDTAANNATALQAAYDASKLKTPLGSALSAINRYVILVGTGTYTFTSTFTINTNYIDIVSLSGNADVYINGLTVTASNTYIKGINCGSFAITLATALSSLKMENCVANSNYSFGSATASTILSGTFINCSSTGDKAFGGYPGCTLSGVFTNCTGAYWAFGYVSSTLSGVFTNCIGTYQSFGYNGTLLSGTFKYCASGDGSFGYNATCSGYFDNCIAGNESWGSATLSGTFRYCKAGYQSFYGIASGSFYNCVAGNISFASATNASGTFYNCIAGTSSFGATASGAFYNCVAGDYSFGSGGLASGTFINCVGGSRSFGGYGGTALGVFTDCIGTDNCFGGTAASGTFKNCVAGDNSFGTGTASGSFINCSALTYSFAPNGSAPGTFINCNAGFWSFGAGGSAGGTFTNCTVVDNGFAAYGTASGTYNHCLGGTNSFGGATGGTITGKLYMCRLSSGTFTAPTGSGKLTLCVDGNNAIQTT